jgi:hypothetical protein
MTSRPPDLVAAAKALNAFTGGHLTSRISALEALFAGESAREAQSLLAEAGISHELLAAANLLKIVAGQIHVVIHTVGILLCIPHLLERDERVEYLSLGAGNTGRSFDLETNLRVAEFKFINWQGGSETIRQNALFKDLYLLAEDPTPKRKFMYVLDTAHPLKFLRSGRTLTSVMSRNRKLWSGSLDRYGERFATVGEYYAERGTQVSLEGIGNLLRDLSLASPAEETPANAAGI